MQQIPPLQKGDTIAIVSTARKISIEEITYSLEVFRSWGLSVTTAPNLFAQDHQFAGTDAQRLADIQWAFDNPQIKAIICARGGYGTARIIDQIDFTNIKQQPKWVAGFSDVTVLLSHLQVHGIECLHAIMPILFPHPNAVNSIESMRKALFGELLEYQVPYNELNKLGTAKGEIVGGNLSIINNLIGTKSDFDFAGKILFIEDIDEYLYHVDRMMVQLDRSGKLANLAALIVGHFTDMKDNTIAFGQDAYQIINQTVKKYAYPVCYGFPIGHAFDNMALICGREAELMVSGAGSMLYANHLPKDSHHLTIEK